MLPGRALARSLSFVGVAGVISAGMAGTALAAGGIALTSTSPSAGAIVQPGAAATVLACFDAALLPSSTLTLSNGGAVAGTTALDSGTCANGIRFTPLSALADGTYTASYNVQGPGLPPATSSGSFVFKVDSVAPAAPTISTYTHPVTSANDATASVTGTAEGLHAASGGVNADNITVSLSVKSPAGGPDVVRTTNTDGSGNYSFTNVDVSGLVDTDSLSYSVKATDAAGNTGTATTQSGVTKDTVGPTLASSTPAAGGTHQSTSTVSLTFDEALDTADSSATVSNKLGTPLGADAPVFSDGDKTLTLTTHTAMSELASPYTVAYDVKDVFGNTRSAGFSFTIDDTAPAQPTNVVATDPINSLDQTAVVVSGDAETGSTDAISLTDGTHTVTASTTADGDGHFQSDPIDVSSGNLTDGLIAVSVVATDAAGNDSPAGTTSVTKDVVVPATPTAVTITPSAVNGGGTPGVTVSATVSGDTTNATISIDDSDGATAPLSVTGVLPDGSHVVAHTFDVSSLSDGTLTASVVAFDASGNPSIAGTDTATKDSNVPPAPTVTISPKPVNASTVGVTVSGTAEGSSTVHISLADADSGTTALTHDVTANASTGQYTWTFVDVSSLHDGVLTASATAEDAVHNISSPGSDSTTMDRVAPAVPAITSAPAYANSSNVTAYPVSGTAENLSSVVVRLSDGTSHVDVPATRNGSGVWSVSGVDVSSLADGVITATAVATDAAGNASAVSDGKTATKDTVAPAKPVVSSLTNPITPANDTSVSVSGTAENLSSVVVRLSDGTSHVDVPATTNGSGVWSVSGLDVSSLADGVITATAVATDAAGNASATSDGKPAAKHTVVPGAPVAIAVHAGDALLTVQWTAPSSDGGSAVDKYTVSVTPQAGGATTSFTTSDATTMSHTFTGLTNGAVYTVSVVAHNVAGNGAPASASGKPRFASTLSMKDSAGHIVDGAKITLSGLLIRSNKTGIAGATVTIFRKLDGKTAGRHLALTTSSTGAWATTIAPAFNATYYAVYTGSASVVAATSSQVRTTVAPRVRIRSPLNKSTSSAATTLKITGRVAPNKAGRTVVLYYVTKTGKLVRLTSAKLSSKSTYVLSTRLKRGTWHLRVVIGASTGNTSGHSSTLTVKRT